jgi:MOSC domain-containing protein YiiM
VSIQNIKIGSVISFAIARSKGMPMERADSVWALSNTGLQGDRYALGLGAYSNARPPKVRHVTFIDESQIAAANAALLGGAPFSFLETRRNVLTRGVDLNALIGVDFQIGMAVFKGVELCHPCDRPSNLLGKPGFREAFGNRGGLRAEILANGFLQELESIWV